MKVNVIDGSVQAKAYQITWASTNCLIDAFGCLILAAPTVTNSFETKDLISEGSVDNVGDRPCRHAKLEGELYEISSTCMTVSRDTVKLNETPQYMACNRYYYDAYENARWRSYDCRGYVFINELPKSIEFPIPDCLQGSRQCKDGLLKIWSEGNFMFTDWYYLWRPSSLDMWRVTHKENVYEFDFANGRFKLNNATKWTNMRAMRKASTSPPQQPPWFPTCWRDYQRIQDHLEREYLKPRDYEVYGDLVRRCANDAVVIESNSISLVKELRELVETLKGAYDLTKGKVDVNKISSAYLSYKYGVRLTVKDLQSISAELQHELQKTYEAQSHVRAKEKIFVSPNEGSSLGDLELEYNYKITHRTYSSVWRDALRTWINTGLFPTLQNIWDMIPLSFVVDWFTSAGDFFSAVDAILYWKTLDIVGVTYSQKQTYQDVLSYFSSSWGTFVGQVSAVYYDRFTRSTVHTPTFFESTPRDFKNYAELSALIVVLSHGK